MDSNGSDLRETDDSVTIFSKNKRTDTQFTASLPPSSKLSATMARIATRVQADNLPSMETDRKRGVKGRLAGAKLRAQIEDTHHRSAGHRSQGSGAGPGERIEEVTRTDSGAGLPQGRAHRYTTAERHELDRKIVYHAKGRGGELYVSAPTGSSEAMLFDEIGERVKTKGLGNEFKTKEKKIRTVVQVERKPGWFRW